MKLRNAGPGPHCSDSRKDEALPSGSIGSRRSGLNSHDEEVQRKKVGPPGCSDQASHGQAFPRPVPCDILGATNGQR